MDSKITSKDMLREMNEITHSYREIVDRAATEKRAYSGEEQASLKQMDERLNVLEADVQRVKKLEEREAFLKEPETRAIKPEVRSQHPDDVAADRMKIEEVFEKRYGARGRIIAQHMSENPTASEEYRKAFRKYLTAAPKSPLALAEYRALSVGDAAGGGYTVPAEEFLAELLKTVDNGAVIRGVARTFTVPKAQSLGVPTLAADPADPTWTGEILVGAEDSTMAFGKREMHPNPLAQYIKISDKLLRASPLGMENIVRDRLAYKISTVLSGVYNTGTGVNQPLGLYTPSADGINTDRDVDCDNGSGALSADGFITARYTLRQGYAPNARWHFHRLVLAAIRKLKNTSSGDFLWQPGLTVGSPNTFLDFPYMVDEYAPSTLTGGGTYYVAALGDFNYYWIVDALDVRIQRVDELFALTGQVGFISRQETDGQPVLADAFVRCTATLT